VQQFFATLNLSRIKLEGLEFSLQSANYDSHYTINRDLIFIVVSTIMDLFTN